MRGSFHFIKSRNRYEANKGKVTLSLEPLDARSHGWWQFVKRVNGVVIFNNYYYSQSTCQHQSKMRGLLDDLRIKVDMVIETSESMEGADSKWMERAISAAGAELVAIDQQSMKGKSGSRAQESRLERHNVLVERIKNLKSLWCEMDKASFTEKFAA